MLSESSKKLPSTQTSVRSDINPLFKKGTLINSGQLLWEDNSTEGDQNITLKIFEKGIMQIKTQQSQNISSFQFQFQICFQANLKNSTLKFYKQDEQVTYIFQHQSKLVDCKNILRHKLNQRGFQDHYKPLKKLGEGAFATVFSGQNLQDNKIYAIKAFSKQATFSEVHGRASIMRELQLMRLLDHKHLMELHQVFQSENSIYIVFEFLEGGHLDDKFKEQHKFTAQETFNIVKGILEGLQNMHSHRIMHRDLKPENILFRIKQYEDFAQTQVNEGWSQQVVIGDFGLSEFEHREEYLFVRCGTPGYVAPEILQLHDMKAHYTVACDIYSLGLIFHILLVGRSLFPGKTYNSVLQQNKDYEYEIKGEPYDSLPKEAIDLLAKMLIKDPSKRISAGEALNHPYITGESLSIIQSISKFTNIPSEQSKSIFDIFLGALKKGKSKSEKTQQTGSFGLKSHSQTEEMTGLGLEDNPESNLQPEVTKSTTNKQANSNLLDILSYYLEF